MDGVMMNGKVLKVKVSNLEFGAKDRYVNVLGCFKYKPNGNIYIVYADTDLKYSLVYYGSGHIRQGVALCMSCREKAEVEIIKEYIFKMTNKEDISNFEIYSLEEINEIEIIGSDKFEVKPEVLTEVVNMLFPKKEEKEEEKKVEEPKKKNSSILLGLILGLLIVGMGYFGYQYYLSLSSNNTTEKSITCVKKYQHDELKAMVDETNKYNFNTSDKLKTVDSTFIYQFNESGYQEFIMKGIYYKYMPSSDIDGGWDKNDDEYTFKVITKEEVDDVGYSEPTDYEEVLSYYKVKGYTCTEEIVTK